jgi:hypothetical protein
MLWAIVAKDIYERALLPVLETTAHKTDEQISLGSVGESCSLSSGGAYCDAVR